MGVTASTVTGSTSVAQNQNVQKNVDLVKKDNAIKNASPFESNNVAKNENLSGMDAFQKTCVDRPQENEKPKSRWQKFKEESRRAFAGTLSFLAPGSGQIANGQVGKGVALGLGYVAAVAGSFLCPPVGIVATGIALYSGWDAMSNIPKEALV